MCVRHSALLLVCCLAAQFCLAADTGSEAGEPATYRQIFERQLTVLTALEGTLASLENQLHTALESSRGSTAASRQALSQYRKLRLLVKRLRQHLWLQQGMLDHLLTQLQSSDDSLRLASESAKAATRSAWTERLLLGAGAVGVGLLAGLLID